MITIVLKFPASICNGCNISNISKDAGARLQFCGAPAKSSKERYGRLKGVITMADDRQHFIILDARSGVHSMSR